MVPYLQDVKSLDTVHSPLLNFTEASISSGYKEKTPMTFLAALDPSSVAGGFGDCCPVDLSTQCGGIYVFYHRPRAPNDNPCQHNRMTLPFLKAGQIFNTA